MIDQRGPARTVQRPASVIKPPVAVGWPAGPRPTGVRHDGSAQRRRWEHATRVEARDFTRWVQVAAKPARPHWRQRDESAQLRPTPAKARVSPNPVTGKTPPGTKYATATAAHSETVLRSFYEFHLDAGSGPMVNPFPLSRKGRGGRANAHDNPMEPFRNERSGLYRPRVGPRAPRQIPDAKFDELFAALGSHRDRALVAFWVSTGAQASELLGVTCGDTAPGQQLITVIRKGSRALQQLPASPDAFVWLRLYQLQMQDLISRGRDQQLWWTLRRPFRQLTYHAAYRMFSRANAHLGSNWSLHDLRHTAAYRMARDPQMPLTDVQWVLGHAQLTTTQLYVSPLPADVIANVLAFHERGTGRQPEASPASRYRPESLDICSGQTGDHGRIESRQATGHRVGVAGGSGPNRDAVAEPALRYP